MARELKRYNIDVVSLSDTTLAGEGSLAECGLTYFWRGCEEGQRRMQGVGFAVKTTLLTGPYRDQPISMCDRLMTWRLPLVCNSYITFISVYAPTLDEEEEDKVVFTNNLTALPGDQPPRGAGGNAGVSTPERLMGHQPATEDPGSRRETRRPVETTAGTVGSGNGRPVTHLKQNIGQCPSGKRTSVRCCVPGAGSRRGGELLTGADCPYLDLDLEQLDNVLRHIDRWDKIVLIWDFNAGVGTESDIWRNVLGTQGIGNWKDEEKWFETVDTLLWAWTPDYKYHI